MEKKNLFIINLTSEHKVKLIIDNNFLNDKYFHSYYIFANVIYKDKYIDQTRCEICDMNYKFFKDYKNTQYKCICPYCQSVYKHRCLANVLKNEKITNKNKVLLISPRTCDVMFFQSYRIFDYDILDICKKQDDNRPTKYCSRYFQSRK